jgi:hypothetical protein
MLKQLHRDYQWWAGATRAPSVLSPSRVWRPKLRLGEVLDNVVSPSRLHAYSQSTVTDRTAPQNIEVSAGTHLIFSHSLALSLTSVPRPHSQLTGGASSDGAGAGSWR